MDERRLARSCRRVARTACIWTLASAAGVFVVGPLALMSLMVSALVWGTAMGIWHALQ